MGFWEPVGSASALVGLHDRVFRYLTKAYMPCESRGVTPWKTELPGVVLTFGLSGQCLFCSVETLPLPHLSGNLSPGSRPRWKIRGSSVCSSWVWVVTPETFCPGQKSMPCNERHRVSERPGARSPCCRDTHSSASLTHAHTALFTGEWA